MKESTQFPEQYKIKMKKAHANLVDIVGSNDSIKMSVEVI